MKRLCLVILDGWGYGPNWGGNSIAVANPKFFNKLWRDYPSTLLAASGRQVGLPGHEAGNSEVGHLNIGAGRVVSLDQTLITNSINDGSFFKNPVLVEIFNRAKENFLNIHVMGLMSDGGVHSYLHHLKALLNFASLQNFKNLYLHLFTDGRDSPPQSALEYLEQVEQMIQDSQTGKIATISGRFYAMDRDHHLERTEKFYEAMVQNVGPKYLSPRQAIATNYRHNLGDEFIIPSVIVNQNGDAIAKVLPRDIIIFFNFRADRARQITKFIKQKLSNILIVTFIPYDFEGQKLTNIVSAFQPDKIENSLTEVLSKIGISQFHIAETEKYAHVTYFFNGNIEKPFPGEDRLLIPSVKISSFDRKPEMAANEITNQLIKRLNQSKYQFFLINYANPDMVGHTGNIHACIEAIKTIDQNLAQLKEVCQANNIDIIISADHGNIEQLLNPVTGEVDTEHTTNPVPFIIVQNKDANKTVKRLKSGGALCDIAPTILDILSIEKPIQMTGQSLIKN